MFTDRQQQNQLQPASSKSGFIDNRGSAGAVEANRGSFNEAVQRKHNSVCICGSCAPTVQRKIDQAIQRVENRFVFGQEPTDKTVQRKHNPQCACPGCVPAQMKVDQTQPVAQLYTTSSIGGFQGKSGNAADTKTRLNKNKYGKAIGNIFKEFGITNYNNHGVFDCGEPHALSKFVEAKGNGALNALKGNPTVGDAMTYHGNNPGVYIPPCKICGQWVKGAQGSHKLGPAVTTNTKLSASRYQTTAV